ncbi:hypothetical protein BDV11DRAFT_175392 [Aspergillus similis]
MFSVAFDVKYVPNALVVRGILSSEFGNAGCAGIILTTLSNGSTLAMATTSDVLDVADMNDIDRHSINAVNLEPFPEFDKLGEIYLGREVPTANLIEAWISPTRKVCLRGYQINTMEKHYQILATLMTA